MIILNISIFLIAIISNIRVALAESVKEVTVDINKDANNPRKRHYIVNKDIVSIAPPGFTEHIYEQSSPFDITNLFFGRKKLEAGTKELNAKMVEKVGVFWKYETPILIFFKHSQSSSKMTFTYYKLTKNKTWTKVDLTEEEMKSLPLSGEPLKNLLTEILKDVGDLPEDRPLPGVGSFGSSSIILTLLIAIIQYLHFI